MVGQYLVEVVHAAFEEGYVAAWHFLFCEGVIAHAAHLGFFAGFAARKALVAAVFADATSVAGGDAAEGGRWGVGGFVCGGFWGWVLVLV